MDQDHVFRIALIAAFLAVMPIAIFHRLKSRTTETLDRRQEGVFILATLRPAGLLFWLGLLAFIVDPSWMAWSSVPIPTWLRWAGVALWAIAGGLLFWTLRQLGSNLTDTVVTRREHTLVTQGPYRWVRNPFYDCAALLVLASALVVANWFLLLIGGLAVILLVVRTRTEEEKLVARFGEDYRAYMKRTGRFLPRIRTNH